MANPNYGHAVYFEFHDDGGEGRVAQYFIVSGNSVNSEPVQYRMYSRTVSPQNPQTAWRLDTVEDTPNTALTFTFNKLVRLKAAEAALKSAVDLFTPISGSIEAIAVFGWTLYNSPFIVQVSGLDYADLAAVNTPNKLIQRINRTRDFLNWDALPQRAPKVAV